MRVERCTISGYRRTVGIRGRSRGVGRLVLGRLPQRLLNVFGAHGVVHWPDRLIDQSKQDHKNQTMCAPGRGGGGGGLLARTHAIAVDRRCLIPAMLEQERYPQFSLVNQCLTRPTDTSSYYDINIVIISVATSSRFAVKLIDISDRSKKCCIFNRRDYTPNTPRDFDLFAHA